VVTESQKQRLAGVRRDLCGSPSPTSLPKQVHLEQAAQALVLLTEVKMCSLVFHLLGALGEIMP